MKTIISVQQISKSFDLQRENRLKYLLNPSDKNSFKKEKILNNISFSIKINETIGLYGPNGSGKSTLLRLIAGILKPDSGKITVSGAITPILELGAGLHPDLSGIENIELYGALIGVNNDIKTTNKIIKLAKLGKYIYLPIKKYSSGMKSRLAFSIAVFSQADILLLDEVFAVGDKNFIYESRQILEKLKKKKTIILSSHNLQLLQGFCDRVIRLENHQIIDKNPFYKLLFDIPYGQFFKTKITSNSMYPLLQKGDSVKVQRSPLNRIKKDDIVAIYFENIQESIIHRVLAKKTNNELIIQGDNNFAIDKWIVKKENLLGKVIL